MNRGSVLKMIILGLWLLIACVLYIHYNQDTKEAIPLPNKIENGSISRKFDISKIIVLNGYTFEITLKNDVKFLGKFPFTTSSEAKGLLINLLNHGTKPVVFVHDKQPDGSWLIDMYIDINGSEINIADWLKEQKLIYQ